MHSGYGQQQWNCYKWSNYCMAKY